MPTVSAIINQWTPTMAELEACVRCNEARLLTAPRGDMSYLVWLIREAHPDVEERKRIGLELGSGASAANFVDEAVVGFGRLRGVEAEPMAYAKLCDQTADACVSASGLLIQVAQTVRADGTAR